MWGIIIAIIFIACAALCIWAISLFSVAIVEISDKITASSSFHKTKQLPEKLLIEGLNTNKIALIKIEGVIGEKSKQTERILNELNQAKEDKDVVAIVLYIDSPGGGVTTSDVIYHKVTEVKEVKPVTVYMDSIAASGGYYISCAGNHITANANTLTGSIGVIISTMNFTGTMEKIGMKANVYTSGAFKDMLSPMRETRPEESEYIQSLVTEAYDGFLNIVSTNRKISINDLMARHAVDGRIITGKNALSLGLVDANGYLEDAIAEAKKLANDPGAQVISYKSSDFENFLDTLFEARSPAKIHVEVGSHAIPALRPGVPYFLPTTYVHGSSHGE